ncbi:hypothetical protein EYF80_021063 [Liparis tanakae]|uniref:Uncharacterized protein n=1 Tax=Liparis tanakae TaxID=230148 RepID=A0A4Z2HT79_9TELE|nr:hypothetical protein EYF80_021063 [Liparis tanakae]
MEEGMEEGYIGLSSFPLQQLRGTVGCSEAPGEQLAVQCLAQGHNYGKSGDGTVYLVVEMDLTMGKRWAPGDRAGCRVTVGA